MGKDCKQILNRLGLTNEELKTSSVILDKLQEYFVHILYERYRFHSAEQQSMDQFVIHLKQLAESCAFTTFHDEMLQDCLVLGSHDHRARTRLFHKKDCDLRKAIETLRVSKITRHQLRDIGDREEPHTVSAVKQQIDKPTIAVDKHKLNHQQMDIIISGAHTVDIHICWITSSAQL